MSNDDELITEPERVTGEFVAVMLDASEEWERHYAGCFICQYGKEEPCSEGQRLLQRATGGQGQ